MPDDLYERDFLVWSEQQADLLRRLAAGERVNEAVDWPHLIEEVQDLGLSELHRGESLLQQALIHLLKAYAFPASLSSRKWRGEAKNFLAQARRSFTPSMRERIGIDGIFADALDIVRTEYKQQSPALPIDCPFVADDLLAPHADVEVLLTKLG